MSCFLHYFELNNPNVSWSLYKEPIPNIKETFENIVEKDESLRVDLHKLKYKGKQIKSYIMSDGFSSDKIFANKYQRKIFLQFLESRRKIKFIKSYFILKLNEQKEFDIIKIESEFLSISILELGETKNIKRNTLYEVKYKK